jgi:hypothetical protein
LNIDGDTVGETDRSWKIGIAATAEQIPIAYLQSLQLRGSFIEIGIGKRQAMAALRCEGTY